ncbi:MAG TPA: arginine--tRNA ligase [Solirubrobacterales bacterium]|nr:arginine--tRNA ligase [Solirubrobacterales bacterium]
MPASDPIGEIRRAFDASAADLLDGGALNTPVSLEQPPRPELGDYSSNAAMLLAAPLARAPREVGEDLAAALRERLGDDLGRAEVAGPGFVNLHLSDRWFRRALAGLARGAGTRIPPVEAQEQVIVEFVSANPTGPLTAAGGRHAAYGDAVARLLEAIGHAVSREYYVNDAGTQIRNFGASIAARVKGEPVPEDGYAGEYVGELAEALAAEGADPADTEALARKGVELMLARIKATLERFGVSFDSWFSERTLHGAGRVEETTETLRASGHVYESEGAIWLRSSELGDDKDRVLVRSGGEPTYLAADIAYHRDKLERGFDRLIDVLGADHHGYLARMRAAIEALGRDPGCFEALVMQLVHIVQGGGRAQMSKRKGEFVTLDELLDDIGVDATRFFMLQRSHDTTVDLDLDLARRQSQENPVYYVQYAHARIASIMRKAGEEGATPAGDGLAEVTAPVEAAERTLIKRLLAMPAEVREAADRRAPHRLCAYSTQVAAEFHAFYRDCKVVGAEGEGVEGSRLALCLATKDAIARTLGLLGIGAPERM